MKPQYILMKDIKKKIGPSFKKIDNDKSISPCPISLNIIPNNIGTVLNIKTEGNI